MKHQLTRSLAALAVIATAVALAACGSSDSGSRYCKVYKTDDGKQVCRTYNPNASSGSDAFLWYWILFSPNNSIQSSTRVYPTGTGSSFSSRPTSAPASYTPPASSLTPTGKAVEQDENGEPEGDAVDEDQVDESEVTDEETSADDAESQAESSDSSSDDSSGDGGDSGGGDSGGE